MREAFRAVFARRGIQSWHKNWIIKRELCYTVCLGSAWKPCSHSLWNPLASPIYWKPIWKMLYGSCYRIQSQSKNQCFEDKLNVLSLSLTKTGLTTSLKHIVMKNPSSSLLWYQTIFSRMIFLLLDLSSWGEHSRLSMAYLCRIYHHPCMAYF